MPPPRRASGGFLVQEEEDSEEEADTASGSAGSANKNKLPRKTYTLYGAFSQRSIKRSGASRSQQAHSQPIPSKIKLVVSPVAPEDRDQLNVQWVGTRPVRTISAKGKQTIKIRWFAYLAASQDLPESETRALDDSFALLLAAGTRSAQPADALVCGMERAFDLTVDFENGVPKRATLTARTKLRAVEDVTFGPNDRNPEIFLSESDPSAACAPQRKAWIECAEVFSKNAPIDQTKCSLDLISAIDLNFGGYMDELATTEFCEIQDQVQLGPL